MIRPSFKWTLVSICITLKYASTTAYNLATRGGDSRTELWRFLLIRSQWSCDPGNRGGWLNRDVGSSDGERCLCLKYLKGQVEAAGIRDHFLKGVLAGFDQRREKYCHPFEIDRNLWKGYCNKSSIKNTNASSWTTKHTGKW